jgi:hypothetical protein
VAVPGPGPTVVLGSNRGEGGTTTGATTPWLCLVLARRPFTPRGKHVSRQSSPAETSRRRNRLEKRKAVAAIMVVGGAAGLP